MRRWLAILLLILLPFQFSWAAVADYCGHETGEAAQHFGHHEHVGHSHASADSRPDNQQQGDAAGLSVADIDCNHCHGYSAGVMEVPLAAVALCVVSKPTASADGPSFGYLPAQPERPQWAGLA